MTVVTSRTDFEKLIVLRLKEAKLLIDEINDWVGAYYLAGYVVEFALKVRIIAQLMKSDSFPDKRVAEHFYKPGHDLAVLRRDADLADDMDKDPAVSLHWDTVKDWSEQSRYKTDIPEKEARDLYDAIANGVLPWIKARW